VAQEPRDPRREAYTDETLVIRRPEQRSEQRAEQRPSQRPQPQRPAGPPPPPPSGPRPQSARPGRRPARRSYWPIVRNVILVLLLLGLIGTVVVYLQIRGVADDVVVRDVRSNPPVASTLGSFNVLLVGVDERVGHAEEGVRSDILLLAHVDTAGAWANMLSIPRDTQIELDGIGITKINTAYYQGYLDPEGMYGPGVTQQQAGMARAAEKVEEFLSLRSQGTRVDYIAQVNFDGFASLVDALGGVTINVPQYILDEEYPTPDFGVMRVEFQPGPQRMDGATALIYARTRHGSSDFDRNARQQQVIRAIADEFRSRGMLGRIGAVPELLGALEGTVTTTMPFDRPDVLLGILMLAARLDPSEIGQLRLSPDVVSMTETFGGNLLWDEQEVRQLSARLLSKPQAEAENALIQVLNGTAVTGLGSRVTGELENAGYRVTIAGNASQADGSPFDTTVVYDLNNKPVTARQIAKGLGASVSNGQLPEGAESSADIVVVLGKDSANR
jgi:LCP family protein required for cell wall assembly